MKKDKYKILNQLKNSNKIVPNNKIINKIFNLLGHMNKVQKINLFLKLKHYKNETKQNKNKMNKNNSKKIIARKKKKKFNYKSPDQQLKK